MSNSDPEIIHIKRRAAIAGYVKDAITDKGILGVTVKVVEKKLSTTTNEDGFFYFVNLEKGQYNLSVLVAQESRSCYGGSDKETSSAVVTVENEPDRADSKPGKPIIDLTNVKLTPTSLTGSVTKNDKSIIPNAIVKLLGSELQTLTDTEGNYTLFGLVEGNVTVQVSYTGFDTKKFEVKLIAGTSIKEQNFILSPTA